jgi:MFS family permease
MVFMITNKKAITTSSYLAMFFLGVATSVVGAAARNIGLSPFQIGMMITIQNVGFIISVSISGALSDTQEKPKIPYQFPVHYQTPKKNPKSFLQGA